MTETTPAAPSEPLARTLLGVPAGHGAPHHDGDRIRPDDFVLQVDESGFIRAGIAHHQNEDGRWYTQNGLCITWPVERADRPDAITVWPTTTLPDGTRVRRDGDRPDGKPRFVKVQEEEEK